MYAGRGTSGRRRGKREVGFRRDKGRKAEDRRGNNYEEGGVVRFARAKDTLDT